MTSEDPYTLYYYRDGEIKSEFKPPGKDDYTGNYENGLRSGIGSCTFANGDFYDGNWEKGKKHGQGLFEWPNG